MKKLKYHSKDLEEKLVLIMSIAKILSLKNYINSEKLITLQNQ